MMAPIIERIKLHLPTAKLTLLSQACMFRANSIDDKQLDFHMGQLMKRIIRSNAVKTSNELTSFLPTKEVSISVMEDRVNSVSLQTILNRQPLVVPYLVVLSGIAFLASSLIWAMNTRVEEASLHFELAPSIGTPKALKTANSVNSHTAVKIIPKDIKTTEAHIKYQTKQPTHVRFVHTYRVVDMLFEE